MFELTWENEGDTQHLAEHLADLVQAGDIICLQGNLGAGKTTFTRYFARRLGIEKHIKSPTFTIIREYQDGRLPLYHMDAYRLEEGGAGDLGLEEYLDGDGVVVIEWPQYIKDDLVPDYLWLTIVQTGPESRSVQIQGRGSRGLELEKALEEVLKHEKSAD